jgi:hypothetical protein
MGNKTVSTELDKLLIGYYLADDQANALCLISAVEEADNAIAQRSTVKLFMNYVRLLKVCIGKSAVSF